MSVCRQEGLLKLETLWQENQLALNCDYELSPIENGLLDAYKAVGDEAKVKVMATRIAGRMLVGRVFEGEPYSRMKNSEPVAH